MAPIVRAVAVLEPLTAPNPAQAKTAAIARPPGIQLSQ